MYMPYIEGLKMDWTVKRCNIHRFLKWKLKGENILECELTALPECQKCKKVITWSGDFGMDQYVSWGLSKDEMNLDTIWKRFESVDLDKFPASRVRQLAKMFESSKATVHHIKEVAGDLQATQINLMRHQRTELPTNRHNKKRRPTGKQKPYRTLEGPVTNQVKKPYNNRKTHKMPD